MANHVYCATSMDGYIATEDGGLDWLMNVPNPDQSDFGFSEFISGIDAMVMGRRTFEKVLGFGSWPYEKPVFVLSHTLTAVPEKLEGKVEIISGEPRSIVGTLHDRGFNDLYIDGGETVQSFLEQDLIDRMIITTVPVVLGSGIRLFGRLEDELNFLLEKTEVLNNHLVKNHYIRIRNND